MDALEMLRDDHESVRNLFEQLEEAEDDADQRYLWALIREELLTHTFLEETVFYPMFSSQEPLADLLEELIEDHQEIKDILEEEEPEDLLEQVEDLRDLIEEHFETEELELFPQIIEMLGTEEIERLGKLVSDARETIRQTRERHSGAA